MCDHNKDEIRVASVYVYYYLTKFIVKTFRPYAKDILYHTSVSCKDFPTTSWKSWLQLYFKSGL